MDKCNDKNNLCQEVGGYNPLEDVDNALTDGDFKFWQVDDKGNIKYIPDGNMYVMADELAAENWLDHYLRKADLNNGGIPALKEFYSVYMYALRVSGFKSITIDVQNPIQIISSEK
ncbi:MAG: hypothetical protein HUK14_11415 [Muribaculaceae bacterium]|nr:hypothetical protein [Muribaculaceae bacterium]